MGNSTSTHLAGRRPTPRLLSQEDFTALADLAFRHDPRKSLTRQMSLYVGVSETTTERWVKADGSPPPVELVCRAYHLAVQRVGDIKALVERTEAAVKAHGLIIACGGERGLLHLDADTGNLIQSDLPRAPCDGR